VIEANLGSLPTRRAAERRVEAGALLSIHSGYLNSASSSPLLLVSVNAQAEIFTSAKGPNRPKLSVESPIAMNIRTQF